MVQRVRRENLADSCLVRYVGCDLPSGGWVGAVLYASEVRGPWYQRTAHWEVASSLALLSWSLIEWVSSSFLRMAVRIASRAHCFALLKPSKGADLERHAAAGLASTIFFIV